MFVGDSQGQNGPNSYNRDPVGHTEEELTEGTPTSPQSGPLHSASFQFPNSYITYFGLKSALSTIRSL